MSTPILVCGNCYRQGKNTVLLVLQAWNYKVIKGADDAWAFVLDDIFYMPDDIGQDTSYVTGRCGRCMNDFFIPKSFIRKRKSKMNNIKNLKVKPVCTECKNTEEFLVIGQIPYLVEEQEHLLIFQKLIDEDQVNQTDLASVILVAKLLREKDYSIPVICKHCNSTNVDLIPTEDNDVINQKEYDAAFVGHTNTY